ncbi:hypothetical protein A6E09_17305 [Aliivibrio fischeri]|nr:hypothetical protein A6E09_17305 [Aliivibrio fischeri]
MLVGLRFGDLGGQDKKLTKLRYKKTPLKKVGFLNRAVIKNNKCINVWRHNTTLKVNLEFTCNA